MHPSPDVVWRELEGEAVLLDLASGVYFGLNEVGTRVWQLLEEGCDRAALVERLADEFEAESARIDADVGALLFELHARGLVVDGPRQPEGSAP